MNKFLLSLLSFLLAVFIFSFVAESRFIAGDEGFYIIAAKLVGSGESLYLDFFYPQMPYLPYLLAPIGEFIGYTWDSMRATSVIASALLAALIVGHVFKETKNLWAAIAAFLLLCLCDFTFAYFPIVKTYGYSVLFLTISVLLLVRHGGFFAFLSGLAFAVSVGIRLHFLLVALPLLLHLYYSKREKKELFIFVAGAAVGAIPAAIMLFSNFDLFMFNNLGYHQLRNRVGLVGGFHQKAATLRNLMGYGGHLGYISFQFLILVVIALVENFYRYKENKQISIYFAVALVLFILSILPTPTYLQYFCILVPFLVIDAGLFLNRMIKNNKFVFVVLFGFCLIAFLYPVHAEYLRYTKTGRNVSGVYNSKNADNWRISRFEQAAKIIDENTKAGEKVITTWPGYLVGSHALPAPGLENHFPISVAHKLTEKELEKYSIVSKPGLSALIKSRSTNLVVLGYRSDKKILKPVLKDAGYTRIWREGRIEIFKLQ